MSSKKPIITSKLYSLLAQRPTIVAYVAEREAFIKDLAKQLKDPDSLTAAYDQLLELDLNPDDLKDAVVLLREAAELPG